ncbi:polyamine-modulated factor 1 isoform X1 [Neophocaena asiaeorientalis asiaeorientalis]|uniref:Polyamine-modulated factor 1 n=4 Tax=Odontoceti TaxID=9722 RepID=A0A8C6BFS6_MONMO|nr:polyamine-modulated factor 1 isoform X1 [Delphinapterus leucas]XP_024603838.1 polyamine-modulated factor 1 isoform X1 [Neophocaena asiaeorientalis asiaeorientalis]XP_029084034.1 polyamine-modulated factor 1 isoform X1 [Monodon monoceros]XP_032485715.1 polyamine-modulated factor 1 isoform X1 [Phocoena sinus]
MAEASGVNVGSGCEEKGPEELSQESARPGTTISRVKLFDTMVDTFIQKLVAAGSYQRFTDCYKCFYQLQPEMTRRIYDKFVTQLQTSIQEEISEIKAEGNLEAVLNALDAIVEGSKDCEEPAWRPSGIPEKDLCSAVVPYFLQQRDALQRRVQKQEAENRQLADAVLAGRRQVEELQLQGQARQQAWQALHREQKELVAVLREPE